MNSELVQYLFIFIIAVMVIFNLLSAFRSAAENRMKREDQEIARQTLGTLNRIAAALEARK